MNPRIKRLDITAFRGIPELPLELDGKSILIRGDNGTGKSSIVDAIEFFFCGRVSHLEGVQGLSVQRYAPHVGFKQKDVNICITFDPGNIELFRTFEKEPECPDPIKDYFYVASSGNFILKRAQILEFITSQPAERFRAISSILGIEELGNYELEIMRARDRLDAGSSSARARIKSIYQELSGLLDIKVERKEEALEGLNKQLKTLNLPIIESFDKISKHAESILEKIKSEEGIRRAIHLEELTTITKTRIIEPHKLIERFEGVNKGIEELSQEQNKKEKSIANLLDMGSRIIYSWELDNCPLCEQEINRKELLQRIQKRLELVRALSAQASEIRKLSAVSVDELSGISRKMRKNSSYIELYYKNEQLLHDPGKCTVITLTAFGLNDEPYQELNSAAYNIGISDHADFHQTLEYIQATGAKEVLTDSIHGVHAKPLASAIKNKLRITARAAKVTRSMEWGV